MKRVTIFLILLIVATILFLSYNNGGNKDSEQPPPVITNDQGDKEQQWQDFINIQKALGYEVMSVAASQGWIEKYGDEISIPNQIAFGEPHIVPELPFIGTMIAVDANDKRRVLTSILVPPPPPVPDGYLDEKESLEWLSENGYEIKKTSDGSITIKKRVQTGNINYVMDRHIGGHAKIVGMGLEEGVFLTAFDGKIYIKDER